MLPFESFCTKLSFHFTLKRSRQELTRSFLRQLIHRSGRTGGGVPFEHLHKPLTRKRNVNMDVKRRITFKFNS